MSDAWNLGDGLENVCRSALKKLHYASFQTEERPRTIVNLDTYEITALIWAIQDFIATCSKGREDLKDVIDING